MRVVLLLLCGATVASAQDLAPAARVRIIPRPRQLTTVEATFRLGAGASIVLADPGSEEDRFAAQDFIDDAKETASVSLRFGKGRARQAIVIGLIDLPLVQAALKRAAVEAPSNLDAEGYVLSVTAGEVVVGGKSPPVFSTACKHSSSWCG